MGKEPLFYEPADKILFLVPKKQVFGWRSDVYLVVDQSKFVELIRQIISEQSDEVDISKKTRLGSLVFTSVRNIFFQMTIWEPW